MKKSNAHLDHKLVTNLNARDLYKNFFQTKKRFFLDETAKFKRNNARNLIRSLGQNQCKEKDQMMSYLIVCIVKHLKTYQGQHLKFR